MSLAGGFVEDDQDTFGFGLGSIHNDVAVGVSVPGWYHEFGPCSSISPSSYEMRFELESSWTVGVG